MINDLTYQIGFDGFRGQFFNKKGRLKRVAIWVNVPNTDVVKGAFCASKYLVRQLNFIPSLVSIFDADKEGFLRSVRSLIQTIGRAARNVEGKVILYADKITDSMRQAIDETDRRRAKQVLYNQTHGITPTSIKKDIQDILGSVYNLDYGTIPEVAEPAILTGYERDLRVADLERRMMEAAADLRFEDAAKYRDDIAQLKTAPLNKQTT